MTELENMAALTALVHQLTQWVGDLQQMFAAEGTATATAAAEVSRKRSQHRQIRRQRISQLERRHQSCFRNQTSRRRGSVQMGRTTTRRRNMRTHRGGTKPCMHTSLHTTGEPRSIVKGSWGNGLEAWRKLKNRLIQKRRRNRMSRR